MTEHKWAVSVYEVKIVDDRVCGLMTFQHEQDAASPPRWFYFSPIDDAVRKIMAQEQLDLQAAVDFFNEHIKKR